MELVEISLSGLIGITFGNSEVIYPEIFVWLKNLRE